MRAQLGNSRRMTTAGPRLAEVGLCFYNSVIPAQKFVRSYCSMIYVYTRLYNSELDFLIEFTLWYNLLCMFAY